VCSRPHGGLPPEQIIALNMEDMALAPLAAGAAPFHDHVVGLVRPGLPMYLFVDEVQRVTEFERALASLQLRHDLDIYVTGSNAQMLSGELSTLLSGRYVEISLLPLSFAEYVAGRRALAASGDDVTPGSRYADYALYGGMPYGLQLLSDRAALQDYFDGLISTILLKDVAVRQKVANPAMLHDVVRFLFGNVGSPTSLRNIAQALGSAGRTPSPHTVESYITGLSNAFLFYPVRRYDVRGKRWLAGPDKYYAVDPGLRQASVGFASADSGQVLENVVYLELCRRRRRVNQGGHRRRCRPDHGVLPDQRLGGDHSVG